MKNKKILSRLINRGNYFNNGTLYKYEFVKVGNEYCLRIYDQENKFINSIEEIKTKLKFPKIIFALKTFFEKKAKVDEIISIDQLFNKPGAKAKAKAELGKKPGAKAKPKAKAEPGTKPGTEPGAEPGAEPGKEKK